MDDPVTERTSRPWSAPVDEGGESVCWLPRVCPECGRLADAEPPTRCPRCGAGIGTDPGADEVGA